MGSTAANGNRFNGNSELRCVRVTLKIGLYLLISNLAKGADGEADGATIVACEVIAAAVMINALHTSVAAGYWLVKDSINRALANAFLAHGAKITDPQMRVFLSGRLRCG